ncbi:Uncharacterised protein [Enterobacter asburiae]|uniref:Uncharacterized protein n=1 Tax=Enterobacter asburiae TaxID=61645 RepID=A0ABC9UH36_ENTAS|nr:hypothetical protein L402_00475 [Enterobacter asburiae]SAB17520.1 Uncharacterised protein [Enterobacter asburiae]
MFTAKEINRLKILQGITERNLSLGQPADIFHELPLLVHRLCMRSI